MTNLRSMRLGNARVSAKGLVKLAALKNLKEWTLDGTRVGDDVAAVLKSMRSLETVRIENAAVTDAGLKEFGECKHLKSLGLSRTAVTVKGIAGLKERSSDLNVSHYVE